MYCVWRSNLGKLIAPRMRRAFKREVLEDFVSSDMTPMEERDPELVINPIFVHKMQRQREKQRAKKVKKMGIGKSGGLARLGLNIDAKVPVVEDEQVKNIKAVDHYLERERGIVDANKKLTKDQREQQGKALLKGQKKAAAGSKHLAAEEKRQAHHAAREHQREANRAAKGAIADKDVEMAEGGGGHWLGKQRSGNGGKSGVRLQEVEQYSAAL